MSHELEQNINADGVLVTNFVSAVQHAWHQLGTVIPHTMTPDEALVAANLHNWNVRKNQATTTVLTEHGVTTLDIPGEYAVIRDNPVTGGIDVIGRVGEKYATFQNEQAFDILAGLMTESNAVIETAGSLRGGRNTFVSMKLPESINLITPNGKRDTTDIYIVVLNSHDGNSSAKVIVAPVRVVCANTQAAALELALNSFSFRHTGNPAEKAQNVTEALNMTYFYAEQFETAMQKLIMRDVNNVQAEKLIKSAFTGDTSAVDVEFSTRMENQFQAVVDLYYNSPTIADVRGTRFGVYNAITEWSDHYQAVQGKDAEYRRAERAALGQSAKFKERAFAILSK